MGRTDELLGRRRGAPPPGLAARPRLGIAVLACMDCRLDLVAVLGLAPGEAHVVRNAGGIATEDVVRSLAISQHLLGTREVVVVQHTDCGLLDNDESTITAQVREGSGAAPELVFGSFDDLDASVRATVATLRTHPLLVATSVRGFVFDVGDGALREVPVPQSAGA